MLESSRTSQPEKFGPTSFYAIRSRGGLCYLEGTTFPPIAALSLAMPVATERQPASAVFLHPDDNIAVASRNLAAGETLDIAGATVRLDQRVPLGHKFAVRPIGKGEYVRKYGQIIGQATENVAPGQWVHS